MRRIALVFNSFVQLPSRRPSPNYTTTWSSIRSPFLTVGLYAPEGEEVYLA